jgi:hypothetical protein
MTPAHQQLLQMMFEHDMRNLQTWLKFSEWANSPEAQRVPTKGETITLPNGFKLIYR